MNEPASSNRFDDSCRNALRNMEQHLAAIAAHPLMLKPPSVGRELLMQFLKGAAFGLGSVAGAGIILSLVVFLLSQIQFVPILGEFIKDLLAQIQAPH
ncbi:MAG: hypothetical protein IT470_07720 [Pseudomonadales bacterium]|nr:hypothetical protein [Pseudomonadales bacterium]